MSYGVLRSYTPGTIANASQMSEGQIFINIPDRAVYVKDESSVQPVAGTPLFETQTSGNQTLVTLPNGLKLIYGEMDLEYVTDSVVAKTVTFIEPFSQIPTMTLSVDTDRSPSGGPTSWSTRVTVSTTSGDGVAYRLDGSPITNTYTLKAYYQVIGV